MPVIFPHGGLGPGTTQGRARRHQQPQIFFRVVVLHDVFRGRQQFRERHERRDALDLRLPQERTSLSFSKAQRARARLVVHLGQGAHAAHGAPPRAERGISGPHRFCAT